MRGFLLGAALFTGFGGFVAMAQRKPDSPVRSDIARAFGELPKPGDLSDILRCAGANEVLWTTARRDDPPDPQAHEAKRKAGWYSAVALWVFQVDSTAVIEAVTTASQRERRAVVALARQCRQAPDSWRE
jgi:hypothetical protein